MIYSTCRFPYSTGMLCRIWVIGIENLAICQGCCKKWATCRFKKGFWATVQKNLVEIKYVCFEKKGFTRGMITSRGTPSFLAHHTGQVVMDHFKLGKATQWSKLVSNC